MVFAVMFVVSVVIVSAVMIVSAVRIVSAVMIVSVVVASVVVEMAAFVVVVLYMQPTEPINFIKRWVMPHLGFKMCQTKLENFHQRSQKFMLWFQEILNIN